MKKTFVFVLLNFLLFSCNSQEKENPKFICKDCGNFDLSKITFKENIDTLLSKTGYSHTVLVNQHTEENQLKEQTKKTPICINKYILRNQNNEILGKDIFNYHNEFTFNNLSFIADSNKKINGYRLSALYEGEVNGIEKFINFLSKYLNVNQKHESLINDNSDIYYWETSDSIYQLVRSNKKKKEESIVNGVKTELNYYYVVFNVYNKINLTNELREIVNKDPYFIIFSKKYFK